MPASQLAIVEQPLFSAANIPFAYPIVVDLDDARGNIVTTDNSNVTLQLTGAPAGGALSGPATVAAVNGIAIFNNISLNTLGVYGFSVTAPGLTGATASNVQVIPVTVPKFLFGAVPLSVPALAFAEQRLLLKFPSQITMAALQFTSPAIEAANTAIASLESSAISPFAAVSPLSTGQPDDSKQKLTDTDKAMLSNT